MIQGAVNADLEAVVELTFVNSRNGRHRIETAVVDTGFNGFVTLAPSLLRELNSPRRGRGRARLANGELDVFDIYAVDLIWDGEQRTVEADAAEIEPLIGMSLMEGHQITVRAENGGLVRIERVG